MHLTRIILGLALVAALALVGGTQGGIGGHQGVPPQTRSSGQTLEGDQGARARPSIAPPGQAGS